MQKTFRNSTNIIQYLINLTCIQEIIYSKFDKSVDLGISIIE